MKPTPSLAHCVWLCTPSRGRTPAARQGRFRGCARTGLRRGPGLHATRVAHSAMEN